MKVRSQTHCLRWNCAWAIQPAYKWPSPAVVSLHLCTKRGGSIPIEAASVPIEKIKFNPKIHCLYLLFVGHPGHSSLYSLQKGCRQAHHWSSGNKYCLKFIAKVSSRIVLDLSCNKLQFACYKIKLESCNHDEDNIIHRICLAESDIEIFE